MLKSAYEGLNARPKVYLSKEYFCEMYPTCVSSKLCEFILSLLLFHFSLFYYFTLIHKLRRTSAMYIPSLLIDGWGRSLMGSHLFHNRKKLWEGGLWNGWMLQNQADIWKPVDQHKGHSHFLQTVILQNVDSLLSGKCINSSYVRCKSTLNLCTVWLSRLSLDIQTNAFDPKSIK